MLLVLSGDGRRSRGTGVRLLLLPLGWRGLLRPGLLGLALGRRRAGLGVDLRRGLLALGGVLRWHAEGVRWREDVDGGLGVAGGDLLAATGAVPVCLLEPVEAAGEGGEADADEAEEGASEAVRG